MEENRKSGMDEEEEAKRRKKIRNEEMEETQEYTMREEGEKLKKDAEKEEQEVEEKKEEGEKEKEDDEEEEEEDKGEEEEKEEKGEEEEEEKEEDEGGENKSLSHAELKEFFAEALSQLLSADPVLSDLHPHVTLEEVNALIELEHGRAMRVYVERQDGECWAVVVPRLASVRQLKTALKNHVALVMNRRNVQKNISWRHIWKTYWLTFQGEKLDNDDKTLLHYGVKNKSTLAFVKRMRERRGR